jgi:formate dehydrogenase assembly factor FdhD
MKGMGYHNRSTKKDDVDQALSALEALMPEIQNTVPIEEYRNLLAKNKELADMVARPVMTKEIAEVFKRCDGFLEKRGKFHKQNMYDIEAIKEHEQFVKDWEALASKLCIGSK